MKIKKTKSNKSKTNKSQIITLNNNSVIDGKLMCTVIMREDDLKACFETLPNEYGAPIIGDYTGVLMSFLCNSIWYGFGNSIVDVVLDDAIREQVKKIEEQNKV
ncbi:hypothetical protein OO184_04145 [Photorhabdus sp. APURE]|uniref:hypothetical protein n=1 Tax=Photorhabdus aballayi TaxID=2991723 RepID=UPI00223E6842|nr:hypothetical protein [Photorhabdus aballayi]MCW7547156.1 hypothetical protein [Photorhabdus aballayi]